jgi:hypothetical protein
MVDCIRFLHEALDAGTAEQNAQDFVDRAMPATTTTDFIAECETELATLISRVNNELPKQDRKPIFDNISEMLASHQSNKLAGLLEKYTGKKQKEISSPLGVKLEPSRPVSSAPHDPVTNAAAEYNKEIYLKPVIDDSNLINRLTAGFSTAQKAAFSKIVRPSREDVRGKINIANRNVNQILNKKVAKINDIPLSLLINFFDKEGSEGFIKHASVDKLQALTSYIAEYNKLYKANSLYRLKAQRQMSRISRLEREIRERS